MGAKETVSVPVQVEQHIRELTKPLRDELRKITKRREQLKLEDQELRAGEKRIEQVLRQLDPASFVAKKNGKVSSTHVGSPETAERKRENIRAYLEQNRDYYEENGIIAAKLYREMKEDGIEPIASPSVVLEAIRELHSNGVLRADKKVKGGAMLYQFVGSNDGKA